MRFYVHITDRLGEDLIKALDASSAAEACAMMAGKGYQVLRAERAPSMTFEEEQQLLADVQELTEAARNMAAVTEAKPKAFSIRRVIGLFLFVITFGLLSLDS